uniref:Uncharacterized protein n=1 Tax=Anguilla anguilla TaxID=7936 RepID=A0A0E9S0B8_ANGAN
MDDSSVQNAIERLVNKIEKQKKVTKKAP